MDAELREGMLMSTIHVRRPTSPSRSGASENLGDPVTLTAYGEVRRRWKPSSAGGERVTEHFFVVDALDVAASALAPALLDSDRFWIEGHDPAKVGFGRKPDKLVDYKDPDTQAVTHWEVSL